MSWLLVDRPDCAGVEFPQRPSAAWHVRLQDQGGQVSGKMKGKRLGLFRQDAKNKRPIEDRLYSVIVLVRYNTH